MASRSGAKLSWPDEPNRPFAIGMPAAFARSVNLQRQKRLNGLGSLRSQRAPFDPVIEVRLVHDRDHSHHLAQIDQVSGIEQLICEANSDTIQCCSIQPCEQLTDWIQHLFVPEVRLHEFPITAGSGSSRA